MTLEEFRKLEPFKNRLDLASFLECCEKINKLDKPETDELYMEAKKIEDMLVAGLLGKAYNAHRIFGIKNIDSVMVDVANDDGSGYRPDKVEIVSVIFVPETGTYNILSKSGEKIPFSFIREVGLVVSAILDRLIKFYNLMDTLVTDGEILTD